MRKEIQIPFGLNKKSSLIWIYDYNEEELVCPSCKMPLIPARGEINRWHFRHKSDVICNFSRESFWHILAKDIIKRKKKIMIPDLKIDGLKIFREQIQLLDNIYLEKKYKEIIPDIIGIYKGKKIFIEIVYTNPPNSNKIDLIKKYKISTLVIYLKDMESVLRGLINQKMGNEAHSELISGFTNELIYQSSGKKWLYNRKFEKLYNQKKKLSKEIQDNRSNFLKIRQGYQNKLDKYLNDSLEYFLDKYPSYLHPIIQKNLNEGVSQHDIYFLKKYEAVVQDVLNGRSIGFSAEHSGVSRSTVKNVRRVMKAVRLI